MNAYCDGLLAIVNIDNFPVALLRSARFQNGDFLSLCSMMLALPEYAPSKRPSELKPTSLSAIKAPRKRFSEKSPHATLQTRSATEESSIQKSAANNQRQALRAASCSLSVLLRLFSQEEPCFLDSAASIPKVKEIILTIIKQMASTTSGSVLTFVSYNIVYKIT